MSLHTFLLWLQNTAFATWVRESGVVFPWVECVHVVSLTLVLGSIAVVDLRLLDIVARNTPAREILRQMLPYTWWAFGFAALSGLVLFSSNAAAYAGNTQFQLKFVAMGLAGVNMLLFHALAWRRVSRWDCEPPWNARISAAVSLLLWVAIVSLGRWVAFTMPVDI